MSDEYIGYGEAPKEEELEPAPKTTFNDLIKEGKHRSRQVKPAVYFLIHGFIAFVSGSLIHYLVTYEHIKPAHVTQLLFSMLVFIYLRMNTIMGGKR